MLTWFFSNNNIKYVIADTVERTMDTVNEVGNIVVNAISKQKRVKTSNEGSWRYTKEFNIIKVTRARITNMIDDVTNTGINSKPIKIHIKINSTDTI